MKQWRSTLKWLITLENSLRIFKQKNTLTLQRKGLQQVFLIFIWCFIIMMIKQHLNFNLTWWRKSSISQMKNSLSFIKSLSFTEKHSEGLMRWSVRKLINFMWIILSEDLTILFSNKTTIHFYHTLKIMQIMLKV